MEATFVVVGGGIAGVSCVESLNILCPETSVILISATSVIKMITGITPLTNLTAEFKIEEKSHEHLSRTNANLRIIIDTVRSINSHERTLKTATERIVKYRYLCLCTGAIPKVVVPDNDFVIGIRDTDSAIKLQRKLQSARRIVVIGNGGIATEVVYELKAVEIVWIVKDKHISATFVDPGAAQFFQDSLNKTVADKELPTRQVFKRLKYTTTTTTSDDDTCKSFMPGAALGPDWHDNINLTGSLTGCNKTKLTVEYDAELKSIEETTTATVVAAGSSSMVNDDEKKSWPVYATLTNGKTYGCDLIISATGVKPNSTNIRLENGRQFNLAADGGINVNWEMKTNEDGIYAAGDVCSADWDKAPHWIQMRLWTQARQMGCYAARSMASNFKTEEQHLMQDFCFELFTHVTRFFGYKVILLGLFNGQTLEDKQYELMVRVTKGMEYVKLVILDGRLQGAVLVGETDLEEMCENLILNQLDLTEFGTDLLNPDIDIEDYFD